MAFGLGLGRLGLTGGAAWTPAQLWPLGAASPGLWIDPSTTTASYQDSAGTTALSAIGTVLDSANPVGLALDRKGGLALGPELVTNGDFSSGIAGWTTVDAQAVVSGELEVSGASATKWSYQVVSTVVGKSYQLGGVRRGGTGTAIIWVGTGSGTKSLGATSSATAGVSASNQLVFTATTTTTYIQCLCSGAGLTAYFDNISVKLLDGLHLSQSTSAARPVASARVNWFPNPDNFSAGSWLKYGTTTITGNQQVTISAVNGGVAAVLPVELNGLPATISAKVRRAGSLDQTFRFICNGVTYSSDFTATAVDQIFSFSFTVWGSVTGIWNNVANSGADLIVSEIQVNLGPTALPYQRVTSGSDYDASAGPTYTKLDGTDDGWLSATFTADTDFTDGMDALIAVRRDSAANAVCGLYQSVAEANKVFGIAESGSGSGCVGSGAGTPTVLVDGTQLTGGTAVTRGTLHTALTPGDWHILEFRNLDLSTWTSIGFGLYTSYVLNGGYGGHKVFSNGQDANRDKARAQMAAYFGVTLP